MGLRSVHTVLLLGVVGASASGQTYLVEPNWQCTQYGPYTYSVPGGGQVTVTATFCAGRTGPWFVLADEYEPVIFGEDRELVPLEGDEVEPSEGSVSTGEPIRGVELARLLMGDKSSDDPDGWGLMSRLDRVEAAAGLYEMHLHAMPGDLIASREYALALLEMKDASGAADRVLEAYSMNPGLGVLPIDGGLVGEDGSRLRTLVVRAVSHAHRVGGADAWLLVSVLMQAEARFETAAAMLGRSEAAGLDPEIAASVRSGLGVSP